MAADRALELLQGLGHQPILVVLAALILDRIVPRRHGRARLTGALSELVRRLDRAGRDEMRLRRRAVVLWLLAVAIGAGAGVLAGRLASHRGGFETALDLVVLVWAIAYRPARATAGRAIPGLRQMAVSRPLSVVEAVAGTARLRLARRFADGSVAVVLAWLVFGLPALAVVKVSQILTEASEAHGSGPFGQVILFCHGVLTLLPCWLAAVLIAGDRRLPPLRLPPRPLLAGIASHGGTPGEPAGRMIATRAAVERGWWLWLAVLALSGGIAAGLA